MALLKGTNSYATVDEANSYFADRIDSAEWDEATSENKAKALITASTLVDSHTFIGSAVDPDNLAWPRNGVMYFDPKAGAYRTVTNTEVPKRVVCACFEQALHLIANEDLLTVMPQTFERIKVGPIELADSNTGGSVERSPRMVLDFLKPLLQAAAQGNSWWRAN